MGRRKKKVWTVREEREGDFPAIESLIETMFQNTLNFGGAQKDILSNMRSEGRFIPELSLLVEADGAIVGYLMLSELPESKTKNGKNSLLLSPVCTQEAYQHQGIATSLIQAAIEKAKQLQYQAIFLIGHPVFYSRFDFVPGKHLGIRESNGAPQDFVLVLELAPGGLEEISEVNLLI
ncbi:GNAT family N-acetyltransferase [Hominifimenecus sp. rT4P-3]|uniref:GNAT family N-acetyltransferase n=1 Tax=Hominifimenecus sp. rT4P-3 TaxID=3242979 RepID=UPI003DA395A5